jgi:murein L,D-transpeptidase YcbB/YkuD
MHKPDHVLSGLAPWVLTALLIAPGAALSQTQLAAIRAQDSEVQRLYTLAHRDQVWTPALAKQLKQVLANANRHGLDETPLASPDLSDDMALSRAALAYADALANGAVAPENGHGIFTLHRNHVDVAGGLSKALASGNLVRWFDSLAPSDAEYRALSDAYVRERSRIGQEGEPVPAGSLIHPGSKDKRVPAIAARLTDAGYLDAAASGAAYSSAMVDAVKALQAANGLRVDGVIGAATLKAINAGPAQRARTLAVNLERRRWLTRNAPATRIDVNTAAAELTLFQDGNITDQRRVIVGQPGHETPMIEASFSRLVINPPWNVPSSIAAAEIFPKGAAYLRKHDMYVKDGRVIQRPGPQSALGKVKFDVQDPYAIYLHDTPSKSLFDSADRHLSHGCVRVADAVGFAQIIAGMTGATDDLEAKLATDDTHTVALDRDFPVRLIYETAFVKDGAVRFVSDVYGWDSRLAEEMGLGALHPEASSSRGAADEGP